VFVLDQLFIYWSRWWNLYFGNRIRVTI